MSERDGGPAFPPTEEMINAFPGRVYESREWWSGMTLRDYFAAAALPGLLASHHTHSTPWAVREAFLMADAMLAERERKPE